MKKKFIFWCNFNFIWPIDRFINGIRWSLSDKDKEKIRLAYHQEAARWWITLNHWEWPDELLPKDSDKHVRGGRRHLLMEMIEEKVGERYISRQHNSKMTDDEFDDFWNMRWDEEAAKRYHQRSMDKLKTNLSKL